MPDRANIRPDHTIHTTDPYFESMGLSMFNISSLERFTTDQSRNLAFIDYLSTEGAVNDGQDIDGGELYRRILGDGTNATILFWNEDGRVYEERDINQYLPATANSGITIIENVVEANKIFLSNLHKQRDDDTDFYANLNFDSETNSEFIRDVKLSSSGCIIWHPTLFHVNNNNALEITPRLCLYLQDPFLNSNKRVIGTKAPYISEIPTTVGGTSYGATETFKNENVDGFPSLRPPIDGGEENPDNKRAGQLDVHYNRNTGKYESGTKQCFAVLLNDLPAVSAPSIDPATFQTASIDSFYGLNGQFNQLGDWSKETHIGSGVVLNVQKANPFLFGPNFIARWKETLSENFPDMNINTNEKELVQVIQRTRASFVAGELVILSYIDGEWIPLKIAEGVAGSSFSFNVNRWEFTKMISDSDSYFRDARLYENDTNGATSANLSVPFPATIDPETYEITMRGKFYRDLFLAGQEDSAIINFQPFLSIEDSESSFSTFLDNNINWDFEPSSRYWQATAFDQTGNFLAGRNEQNIIARTNWVNPPSIVPDDEDTPPPEDFVEWWGPSFMNGYNVSDVSNLLSNRANVSLSAYGSAASDFFFLPGETGYDGTPSQPAYVDVGDGLARNWSLSFESPGGMFGNPADRTASNLPAEIALNTTPNEDGFGSPLENLSILFENYGCSGVSMLEGTNNIFGIDAFTGEQARFNWVYTVDTDLDNSGIFNPAFNLRPNNINIIDFFPLHGEVISSADFELVDGEREYRNEDLASAYLNNANFPEHALGGQSFFDRNSHCNINFFNVDGVGPVIPYDEYTINKSPAGSRNVLGIWEEEDSSPRADTVGVISAKANINFRGNELRFIADQQLGIRVINRTVIGNGTTFGSTGLGIFQTGPTFVPGNQQTFTDIRWGGGSDRPQDFNTTALHVKVFDAWPTNQTIYDPRYFGVFHFNPGQILSDVEVDETTVIMGASGVEYNPDRITTAVDFRVPTDTNNNILPIGPVGSGVSFAPQRSWRINPIRRGMMLSQGGFRYRKKVSGLDPDSIDIINPGTGYLVGDILNVSGNGRNVVINITQVGSGGEIIANGLEYISLGEGFTPESFLNNNVRVFGGTGSGAEIVYNNALIYEQILVDDGPVNHSSPFLRLTDPSSRGQGNRGNGDVTGVAERSLVISQPNSDNNYDLFFHFHNDITHTTLAEQNDIVFPPQRLSLEIGAI